MPGSRDSLQAACHQQPLQPRAQTRTHQTAAHAAGALAARKRDREQEALGLRLESELQSLHKAHSISGQPL